MSRPIRHDGREPFIARDRSTVRELVHPDFSDARSQSLAEARLEPGSETAEHFHRRSEEIYCFVAGSGRMRLAGEEFDVRAGESVVIGPGVPHKLWNDGPGELRLLCCCAPAYSDEDTVLTESQ